MGWLKRQERLVHPTDIDRWASARNKSRESWDCFHNPLRLSQIRTAIEFDLEIDTITTPIYETSTWASAWFIETPNLAEVLRIYFLNLGRGQAIGFVTGFMTYTSIIGEFPASHLRITYPINPDSHTASWPIEYHWSGITQQSIMVPLDADYIEQLPLAYEYDSIEFAYQRASKPSSCE